MRFPRGPLGLDAFMIGAVAVLGGLGALGAWRGGFGLELSSAWPVLGGCAALGALRVAYERRDPNLRALLRSALWSIALSNAYLVPMYAVTRLGRPLGDGWLRAADGWLGVDVVAIAAWVRATPWLARGAALAYESLQPLCMASVLLTTLTGQGRRAERGVLSLVLASFFTLLVHGAAPAVGPWVGGGVALPEQSSMEEVLRAIRAGWGFTIDLARPDPLVAFPSWHVILAVLCGAALAGVRRLAPLAALWSALIAISTVLTGWHYAVDVLGALATSAAAYWGSGRLQRWLESAEPGGL